MSDVQTSLPTTLVASEPIISSGTTAPAGLRTCLVVSASPLRSQLLLRAAHQEHWSTIVSRSAEDAARQIIRHRIQLALVDLQSAPAGQERAYRELVEQLASRDGPLVAVCGAPNDTVGEVWSRQLGVWMYLPGIDSESDVAMLCYEARNIVEKLYGRASEHVA
jgi:hypothetical protein